MKFRSWYIVLLGLLLQGGLGVLFISSAKDTDAVGGIIAITLGLIVLIFTLGLGIIPLLLLVFKKTRKIGAIVSIVFGVIGIITQVGIILGPFLLIAGVIALWRKT